MTEQEYRLSINKYRDSDGLITPIPHPGTSPNGSGNGLLYTTLHVLMLYQNQWLTTEDRSEYEGLLLLSMEDSGLLNRGPHHHDQQAMDDYVAVCCGAYFLSLEAIAAAINNYGKRPAQTDWVLKVNYYYNNVMPGTFRHRDGRVNWNAWIGRMPQVAAHIQISAGEKPRLFHRILWAVTVLLGSRADAKDQDAWVLNWFLVTLREHKCPSAVSRAVTWMWRRQLSRKVGGMCDLLRRVLSDEHPIASTWTE